MDVAHVSAMAALGGSVVGGLTAGGTTWLSQRAHVRARQIAHEAGLREDLYRDFIMAASRAYSDALLNSEPQIPKLVSLYAIERAFWQPVRLQLAERAPITAAQLVRWVHHPRPPSDEALRSGPTTEHRVRTAE